MHLRTDTNKMSPLANNPSISLPRNSFRLYERHVTTMKFDYLYPIYHKFMYPGDTISGALRGVVRLQTQATYLFDDLFLDFHAWGNPMRLLQTNWARYQFDYRETPLQDNTTLTSPGLDFTANGAIYSNVTGFASKTLYDYLKYPTLVDMHLSTQHWNNYLGRAYNNLIDKNYRDVNWMTPPVLDRDDGPDNPNDYPLVKRGKRFDWVTSGTSSAMKSQTVLGAPVTGTGLVNTNGSTPTFTGSGATNGPLAVAGTTTDSLFVGTATANGPIAFGNQSGLYADLTGGLAYMLINDLRTTVAVQHFYENNNIGGATDVDSIKMRWGVVVPDFRMNRPEYLGGATYSFDGHVVPQTSETATTPQGTLTSFSQMQFNFGITHSFVEHSVFMVLVSARSNMTYQQGIDREITHRTRLDWYQPEFAHTGNVAILAREVMVTGVDANDTNPFVYNEYGYWMRWPKSYVTGEMRSNFPTSLDSRHMAYDFVAPVADASFFQSNTPIDRNIVVASSVADPIELNCVFDGTIARVLPVHSIPGLERL